MQQNAKVPMYLRWSNTTALVRILSYFMVSSISKMAACNRKCIYTTSLPQTLTWKSICFSPVMTLDAKNISKTIRISCLSCFMFTSWDIRYSITTSGCRPPSLISHSPQHTACLDQSSRVAWKRNIGIAVEISLLFRIQAEINIISNLLPITGRHLWFSIHSDKRQCLNLSSHVAWHRKYRYNIAAGISLLSCK